MNSFLLLSIYTTVLLKSLDMLNHFLTDSVNMYTVDLFTTDIRRLQGQFSIIKKSSGQRAFHFSFLVTVILLSGEC